MTEQDLKNIEVVFAIARKELALDENQLNALTPEEEEQKL
jgi:2-hydroxychromene-2-carboxylate isomerase